MFDENSAKQLVLRILHLPVPEQISDQSLKFVILFFQNKKKWISKKTKSIDPNLPFNSFMQEIFGDNELQGNYSFSWSSLSIINLKIKSHNLTENDLKAASLFVFYAALDWLTLFEIKNIEINSKHDNLPFLPDTSLLDTILTVSVAYKAFEQFSLSLFCLIFTRIAFIEPVASPKILSGSGHKFIGSVTSKDSLTLHLVSWTSLINSKYEKYYSEEGYIAMPQPLRIVLELVMQAIQIVPGYFSMGDAQTIFKILKPFAIESCRCNDPFPLNLIVILAPFLEIDEVDQMFQAGVLSLMSYVSSNQPFINFSELKINFSELKINFSSQTDKTNNKEQEKTNNKEQEDTNNKEQEDTNNKEQEDTNNKEQEDTNNKEQEETNNKEQEETNNKEQEETNNKEQEDAINNDLHKKTSTFDNSRENCPVANSLRLFNERGNLQPVPFFISKSDLTSSQLLLSCIPNSVKSVASLLKHTLENSSRMSCELFPAQIDSFINDIRKEGQNSDHFWSILTVLLFLCENSNFEEPSLCEFFQYILEETQLFNAPYSIYQPSDSLSKSEHLNLSIFLSLRFYAIKIFVSPTQISCFQLYWNKVSHNVFTNKASESDLALFAEFFSFMEAFKFTDLLSSVLPICISDTYFVSLRMSDSSLVSFSILQLIVSVFKTEKKSKELFSNFFLNDSFLDFLFSAIFDSYFSDAALSIISSCAVRFADNLSGRFCNSFRAISEVNDINFIIENQDIISHHVTVLCELFEMIIGFLLQHSEKAASFIPLFQISYQTIKNLSSLHIKIPDVKTELLTSICSLLHNFIKFASVASIDERDNLSWMSSKAASKEKSAFKMTQNVLDGILTAIKSFEGNEPSTPCFSSLMFASSCGKSSSLRAEFLIARPSFVTLTIRAFSPSSRLSGVLKFVSSLCDFSTANCRACHVGGVDNELVKVIQNDSSSTAVLKDSLHLFSQIAQTSSSTSVVASFMKCFHSIKEPYKMSPVMIQAVNTLDLILAHGSNTPAAFLPAMNELPFIRVEGLTEDDLCNGFTLISWIFIDGGSQDSPASIMSICRENPSQNEASNKEFSSTALLTVIVQLGRVFIGNSRVLGGRDAIVLDDFVPTDRWTMIAITFECSKANKNKDSCDFIIKSFINNKSSTSKQKIPVEISSSKNRPLTIISCGNVGGGNDLEHPALVASVALFPIIRPHTCLEIVQNGLLLTRSNTERSNASLQVVEKMPNPFFCALIESENSVLCVSNNGIKRPKASKVILDGRTIMQQMPFADIFTRFFTARSLIPLFAMMSLKSISSQQNENEEEICLKERNQLLASSAIRVLFHALQMSSQTSCREFVASGGFKIVSFLLSNFPESLTPTLFNQVVALAKESSSKEVRMETSDEIIFNEKLWSLSSVDTQSFVVQQLINLAYEKQDEYSIHSSRSLSDFLSSILFLYWVKEHEKNDLQILIMNSVVVRSGDYLSLTDVGVLIGAATFSDSKISIDVLYMMQQIALMPDTFASFTDKDFFHLHVLIQRGCGAVICALMRFVVAIHSSQRKCIFTLGEHATIIANEILITSNFTEDDIGQLSDMVDTYPAVFPVFCAAISAFSIENSIHDSFESAFSSFLNSQKKNEVVKDWTIWPVYASLNKNGQELPKTVNFMLKSSLNFVELFGQSIVCSETAGDESGSACRELLLQVGTEFLMKRIDKEDNNFHDDQISSQKVDNYIGLCFYFIFFFGSNKALSQSYLKEGVESGLVDPIALQKKAISFSLKRPPFSFFTGSSIEKPSFNVNEESEWIDKELALQCVQVIAKKKLTKYSNLALFFLTYLVRFLPNQSLTLLHELKTIASFDGPFSNLFMFAQNHSNAPPADHTAAFEILVDQFRQQTSSVQVVIDSCSRRLNGILHRYSSALRSEKRMNSSIRLFDPKTVETEIQEEKRASNQLWKSLWRKMTFDCAPWHSCLDSSSGSTRRWKRDETLCTRSLIPMKMKVNYKFDDHNEASLGRELGNMKLAREQNEETKRRQRALSLCPEILETSSLFDSEKKKEERIEKMGSEVNDDDSYTNSSHSKSTVKSSKNSSFSLLKARSFSHGLGFDSATRIRFSSSSHSSQQLVFMCECQRIRVSHTRDCLFSLFNEEIKLQFKRKTRTIKMNDILRVFLRAPLHHPHGIEIITRQGASHFLVFPEKVKNIDVASAISSLAPPSIRPFVQNCESKEFFISHGITTIWQKRNMSNFEYLMMLNYYSGRSFSQLSMYPFLPWVLVDYDSDEIDIQDPSSFRDLSSPVGKLGQKRLESLRKRSQEMQEFGNIPFLYSSFAVSPLIVILWMMREEPFTSLHIEMQSGKFDHAARQFSSIPDTFRMIQAHLNDFRELIPEFFFTKEFLVNENKFDLGFANDSKIDNVVLPKWCHNDALTFVYYLRKALESDFVSSHLNDWIDLIWGFKQRGKEAEKADNTYDPSIYSDVWNEETLNDPERRSLIDETLTHCGQIPDQLFTSPHPQRELKELNKSEVNCKSLHSLSIGGDHVLFGTVREINEVTNDNRSFEIVLLTSSGKFFDCKISENEKESDVTEITVTSLLRGLSLNVEDASAFAVFSLDEIAFGTSSGKVTLIDTKKQSVCSLQPHEGRVNCVASSAPFIVSGGSDTVISCIEKVVTLTNSSQNSKGGQLKRVFSMAAYSSEVVCSAVSKEFHVVASGTRDGHVIVQSLEKSNVTCVIDLQNDRKPSHITITRAWGFIVVCAVREHDGNEPDDGDSEILVFTLKGELVGQRKIEGKVSKILTWASNDGFDFLTAALDVGKIIAFEAFYLSGDLIVVADSGNATTQSCLCRLPEGFGCYGNEIVVMSYSIESGTLVAISKSGSVSLINNFFINTQRLMKKL